jgi:DNA-binding response OmpR family regulator
MSEANRLLHVEDEALIRESSAMELEDAGFEVVVAGNGVAAVEALETNPYPFCALVTDVNLGDGPDGWQVARRGRELNQALPVIYVTGAAADQWKSEGVPGSLVLGKPFTVNQIVQGLRSLLCLSKGS